MNKTHKKGGRMMKGVLNLRGTQINKNWRPDVTPAPNTNSTSLFT